MAQKPVFEYSSLSITCGGQFTTEHESDGQASLWDKQRAGQLRSLLVHVSDSLVRQKLEAVLDVSGIIDFGELLRAPRIIEVSAAAEYLRPNDGDPLELLVPLVGASRCNQQ